MKSTRRRLLTALTGMIALPVLPRASSTTRSSSHPCAIRTLRDCLASQQFPQPGDIQRPRHFATWEETQRRPLTLPDLEIQEEHLRYELHGQRIACNHPHLAARLEAGQQACRLARLILDIQPTGRPLVFNYLGGTTPNRERTVLPTLLFRPDEFHDDASSPSWNHLAPLYLQAYCIDRLAPRTFRLDRIQSLTLLTPT